MQISHNYMYMYLSSFLSLPLSLSHPSRSSQNTRLDSLCHIATAHQLSILHTALCICWGCSRHLAHSLLPTLCPQVHSLHLCLHSFPKNNFLNTILLDSIYIYINIRYLFFSFWLTSVCTTGSRFIHLTRPDSNLFFYMADIIPLYMCTTSSLSIHL